MAVPGYDKSRYDRPSVTVDLVILTIRARGLHVLLVKRDVEPYRDHWALPGGFVGIDEDLEDAARRELKEETGVSDVYLEQLYTFGSPQRDPRMRVITVAYYALIPSDHLSLQAATDVNEVSWFSVDRHPALAFDHETILRYTLERMRNKIMYVPLAFRLLPEKFTLTELQLTYEVILKEPLDKRNFRKKILSSDLLEETDELRRAGCHRPAALYRFAHLPPAPPSPSHESN